ncbi:SDR family NAD(P)-dependent oxidoreductase [Ramlibacter alkalitolerans]|uniref:SDR family NAD(P)-dependent oxidoreductase n=1 Tax=Ramlibacter alkalitolerans TaxID=2039631 RepID=A0ABS1JVH9_9BURK|nr:SDR family NAD(P)-dependent oxidoreductase [Ramlibacter alkalitolerans]MBL0428233.1 SDR family NAD(P)-dependent oxidoreductase [Ramlibacter alkalitolerans]
MTHLTILTGASRGMGLAMARQLLDAGHDLLCISRKTSEELAQQATRLGRRCEQWPQDLARAENAAERLATWLQARDAADSVTLINNAGLIPRVAPLDDIPAAQLAEAMRVDLEAPLLLTAAFLRATAAWTVPRRILNISSGLGRRAMAAQAAYCAAKAGMDHFSRCVALEQARLPHGAKICSLAPGVIDTDMQVQLRGADSDRFPDRGNFVGLKEKGLLSSPDEAAARVLAVLARPDFGANPVADVRD